MRRVLDLVCTIELRHRIALGSDDEVTGDGIHPGRLVQIEHPVDQRERAFERVRGAAGENGRRHLRHAAAPPFHRTCPGDRAAENRPIAAAGLDDQSVTVEINVAALRARHPAKRRIPGEPVVHILPELLGGIDVLSRDLGGVQVKLASHEQSGEENEFRGHSIWSGLDGKSPIAFQKLW